MGRGQAQSLTPCFFQLAVQSGTHCRQWVSFVLMALQQRIPVFFKNYFCVLEVFNKHFAL